jgi:hypothetical protein
MKRTTLTLVALATLGLLAVVGCSGNTKLTNLWADPNFQTNSLKKLMVIAVAQNTGLRRTFEDTFAQALRGEGVQAVTSYSTVGEGALDSVGVNTALQRSGCDGVFITRLVDKKTVDTYYAPTTTYVGAPNAYYGGWYGYYSTSYAYMSTPGYTVQNEVLNIETNLYRVSDAKLVWSALSQSWLEQSASPGNEIQPFVSQLVYGLSKSKVVTKTKSK